MVDQAVLERLGFVRFLYDDSVGRASAPEPTRSAALLTLHDSLELFLGAAWTAQNITQAGREFLQLFDALAAAISGIEGRGLLERLNKARVGLKHYGNQPSARQVAMFVAEAGAFFATNTPLIFGIPFEEVSIAHLVVNEKVRAALSRAEQEMSAGDGDKAVFFVSTAWNELMWAFEKARLHHYPLFNDPLGESYSLAEPFKTSGGRGDQLSDHLASLDTRIRWLARAVMVMALNLDFESYRRFERVASWPHRDDEGNIVTVSGRGEQNLSIEEAREHFNLVLDAAIRIQAVQ